MRDHSIAVDDVDQRPDSKEQSICGSILRLNDVGAPADIARLLERKWPHEKEMKKHEQTGPSIGYQGA